MILSRKHIMASSIRYTILLCLCPTLVGCSIKGMVVSSMGGFFEDAVHSLQSEKDLELAEYSLASDIKLLDAMLRSKPGDRKLTTLAVQGRCSFAMAFAEEEAPERALALYRKAMKDGLGALDRVPGLSRSIAERDEEGLVESLSRIKRKDLPLFFWTLSAWASWVNASRDDPEAVSQVPLVERAVQWMIDREEDYFFGGPHLMAGVFYSCRPALLGGDPDKGRIHFQRCIALSQGRNLMARVLFAETYAVQTQDRALFGELLKGLEGTPESEPDELVLMNQVARRRGERLLLSEDELFF